MKPELITAGRNGFFRLKKQKVKCLHSKLDLNLNGKEDTLSQEIKAERIIGYLQDFGLNEKEARIYLNLSKVGSATAAEISAISNYSKLQTYRAIKSLLNIGLIEMSLERPRRYTPLKIEQALNLLGQEAERKINELEKKAPILLKEWSSISDLQVDRTKYSFRIIQGEKNVYKFRIMLYESAKERIAYTMKPTELAKLVSHGTDDVIERLSKSNIAIRGLSQMNALNLDASKRFLEFTKLNHVSHSNIVPFSIIDDP